MPLYESDSALFIQILHDYTLPQQTLENVQSARYLGITIKANKDWCQHISDISSIATKTLGFRHRNGFHKVVTYKNSEYDQEISQSQTADNPVAPRGRAAQPSRDTRKTN